MMKRPNLLMALAVKPMVLEGVSIEPGLLLGDGGELVHLTPAEALVLLAWLREHEGVLVTMVTGHERPNAGSGPTWKRAVRRVLGPASRAGPSRDHRSTHS